jgi:hypothetical protein
MTPPNRFSVVVWALFFACSACDHRTVPSTADATPDAATDASIPDGHTYTGDGMAPYAAQVAKACAVAAGCAPASEPKVTSICIQAFATYGWPGGWEGHQEDPRDSELMQRMVSCAAAHGGSCDAFHACYGGNWVRVDICRAGICEGSRMVDQLDPTVYLDCASFGGTCVFNADMKRACCRRKPCASTVCHSKTRGTRCTGFDLDASLEFDCAATGLVCVPGLDSGCAGGGPSCAPDTVPAQCLDATKVRWCAAGHEVTFDCASHAFFQACIDPGDAPPPPLCSPAGKECQWSEENTCQGDDLVVCVDGYRRTVSCKQLGFGTCIEDANLGRCGK